MPPVSFGQWLKQRRKQLDLTQSELARSVGCAVATVKKFEIDQRRPSRDLAERMARILCLTDEEQITFLRLARNVPDAAPPLPMLDPRPVLDQCPMLVPALPIPLTPLVGREQEIMRICSVLQGEHVRLVSLVGPPGVGKTRLALQIAAELRDQFAVGVCFVPLAVLSDPAFVIPTIARMLGVRETAEHDLLSLLQARLHNQHVLLLLDNFEQVRTAAPLLVALLTTSPYLKVIITSQVRLRVSGEHVFSVPGLAVPPTHACTELVHVAQSAAVTLFVQRAQAMKSDFLLTPDIARTVAAICTRLDGLPLAIELAAARIRIFSPQTILARLDKPLALLTEGAQDLPDRQQTLRNAIDWSYQLLGNDEQALFRQLAVFVGTWTVDAVESICCSDDRSGRPIIDQLSSLLDKSLVQRIDVGGASRFMLLETLRAYAREQLDSTKDLNTTQRRHADYYLRLFEDANDALQGPNRTACLARIEHEQDNARAALQWALDHGDIEIAHHLVSSFRLFWYFQSHLSEGLQWIERTLQLEAPPALCAQTLSCATTLAAELGYFQRAIAYGQRCLAIHQAVNDQRGMSRTLNNLGLLAQEQRDYRQAQGYLHASLAIKRDLGDIRGIATSLINLGGTAMSAGDMQAAQDYLAEGLALARDIGDDTLVITALNVLGWLATEHDQPTATSAAYFHEALVLSSAIGGHHDLADLIEGAAGIAVAQNQYVCAAHLLGAAQQMRATTGQTHSPNDLPYYNRVLAATRAYAEPDTIDAAWAAGQSLSLVAVIAYAQRATRLLS